MLKLENSDLTDEIVRHVGIRKHGLLGRKGLTFPCVQIIECLHEFRHEFLFLLQKKILRCINFQPFSAPSTPIFLSLKILKVEDLLHLNILTFVYKSIKKLSPSCFHNYFTPNSSVHRFGTRQATRGDLFKSFKNTTVYGLQTIQVFGSKLWNALPLFIRVASCVSVFRSKLKTYFINSYS